MEDAYFRGNAKSSRGLCGRDGDHEGNESRGNHQQRGHFVCRGETRGAVQAVLAL